MVSAAQSLSIQMLLVSLLTFNNSSIPKILHFSVGSTEVLTMADSFPEDLEIQEAFRLSKCTPVPSDGDKKRLYPKR